MKIEKIKIEKLKPYKLNAKKHPQSQIEGIAESIKRFGFTQPIVIDGNDEIIIGHGRLEAAKILKMDDVPCVKRNDLTPQQIKALRLIDNRIAETGWDNEILALDLHDVTYDFKELNIDFNFLADEILSKDNKNEDKENAHDSMQFIVAIHCENENQQQEIFEEMQTRGLECKLIM